MSENESKEWPPLKKALWRVVTDEKLNARYVDAWTLTEKLYEAAKPLSRPDGEAIAGTGGAREACAVATERSAVLCEKAVCERYEQGTSERRAWNEATIDLAKMIRASLANDAPPIAAAAQGEAVAFDPLNGGCPHCKWLDTNLGRTLDKKCGLHQRIEDVMVDRELDRRIIREQGDTIRRFCEAIGAGDDDDPVALAKERMDEIAELDATPSAPARAPEPAAVVVADTAAKEA